MGDMGIGGVLGLLWFQRRLPPYACKFLEMCLMITADHGPAVSGAHNTIVCARAGKDLVSSLVSGLLTIGDRFGGALDDAARMFTDAFDAGTIPMDFVNNTKKRPTHNGHRAPRQKLEQPRQASDLGGRVCKAELPLHPL